MSAVTCVVGSPATSVSPTIFVFLRHEFGLMKNIPAVFVMPLSYFGAGAARFVAIWSDCR